MRTLDGDVIYLGGRPRTKIDPPLSQYYLETDFHEAQNSSNDGDVPNVDSEMQNMESSEGET